MRRVQWPRGPSSRRGGAMAADVVERAHPPVVAAQREQRLADEVEDTGSRRASGISETWQMICQDGRKMRSRSSARNSGSVYAHDGRLKSSAGNSVMRLDNKPARGRGGKDQCLVPVGSPYFAKSRAR